MLLVARLIIWYHHSSLIPLVTNNHQMSRRENDFSSNFRKAAHQDIRSKYMTSLENVIFISVPVHLDLMRWLRLLIRNRSGMGIKLSSWRRLMPKACVPFIQASPLWKGGNTPTTAIGGDDGNNDDKNNLNLMGTCENVLRLVHVSTILVVIKSANIDCESKVCFTNYEQQVNQQRNDCQTWKTRTWPLLLYSHTWIGKLV